VAAVVGGGFIPERLRGTSSDALMHMVDWWVTLAQLAGVSTTGPVFINGSMHDVDGVDMWPAITGANTTSPRPWLPTTEGSILWQQPDGPIFKLLTNVGTTPWASPSRLFTPNGTIYNDTSALGWNGTHAVECVWVSADGAHCALCDPAPAHPCLFEVKGDPGETRNLVGDPAHASTIAIMAAKLASYVPYVDGTMSAEQLAGCDCPDTSPGAREGAGAVRIANSPLSLYSLYGERGG
jgi:hypothetical protein